MDILERLFELWTRVSDVDSVTLRDAEDEIKKLRAALRKLYDHEGERVLNSIGVECYTVELEDALCEARAALGETE